MKFSSILLVAILLLAVFAIGCGDGTVHAQDEPKGAPVGHAADGSVLPAGIPGAK